MSDEFDMDFNDPMLDDDSGGGLDFDMDESLTPKDDRKPITRAGDSFLESVKDSMTDPSKVTSSIAANLPSGYKTALSGADEVMSTGRELYNEAAKEVRPALMELKKSTRRIMPMLKGSLPESITGKIESLLGDDEQREQAAAVSEEQQRDASIASSLDAIFMTQAQQSQDQAQEQTARDMIRQNVEDTQHRESVSVGVDTANQLRKIHAYFDGIDAKVSRQSLELKFRTYYTLRDLLEVTKRTSADSVQNLAVIAKNTALPDIVKYQQTEALQDQMRERLFGSMLNEGDKAIAPLTDAIKANVQRKFKEKVSEVKETVTTIAEQLAMIGDQAEDMEEMGGLDGAEMAGGMLGDVAASRMTNFLARNLVKAAQNNLPGFDKFNKLLELSTADFQGLVKRIVDSEEGEEIIVGGKKVPEAVLKFVRDNSEGVAASHAETLAYTSKLKEQADAATIFDNMTKKSITEIIPDFLSRQLAVQEQLSSDVREIGTAVAPEGFEFQNNMTEADRKVFNIDRGTLSTMAELQQDVLGKVFDKKAEAARGAELATFTKRLDEDNKLTDEQMQQLTKFIATHSDTGQDFDAVTIAKRLEDSDEIVEADREAILQVVKDSLGFEGDKLGETANNTARRNLKKRFMELRDHKTDSQKNLGQYAIAGQGMNLASAGILDVDSKKGLSFDEKYLQKRRNSYIDQAVELGEENQYQREFKEKEKDPNAPDLEERMSQNLNKGIFGQFAEGGQVKKDEPVIVGENEPEVFIPDADGTVSNNKLVVSITRKYEDLKKRYDSFVSGESKPTTEEAKAEEDATEGKFSFSKMMEGINGWARKDDVKNAVLEDEDTDKELESLKTEYTKAKEEMKEQTSFITSFWNRTTKDEDGKFKGASAAFKSLGEEFAGKWKEVQDEEKAKVDEADVATAKAMDEVAEVPKAVISLVEKFRNSIGGAGTQERTAPEDQDGTYDSANISSVAENTLSLNERINNLLNVNTEGFSTLIEAVSNISTLGIDGKGIKSAFGKLGSGIKGVGKGAWGITKGAGKLGFGAIKGTGNLGLGAAKLAGKLAMGTGRLLMSPIRSLRTADIYVKGAKEPALLHKDLVDGKYYHSNGTKVGKPLKSFKDITGPIMNAKGKVVLTQEDIDTGLTSWNGKKFVVRTFRGLKNAVMGAGGFLVRNTIGRIPPAIRAIAGFIGRSTGWVKDKFLALNNKHLRTDIYLDGEQYPVLTYKNLQKGKYFMKDKNGKMIMLTSFMKMKGHIYSRNGRVLLEPDDYKRMVDSEGKRLKIVGLMGMAFNTAAFLPRKIKGLLWNKPRDFIKGKMAKAKERLFDTDIYIAGSKRPVLTLAKLKKGLYRLESKPDEPLRSFAMIDGPVLNSRGRVILTQEDIDEGLYNSEGKKLVFKGLLSKIGKGLASIVTSPIKAVKGAVKGVGKAIGGVVGGLAGGIAGMATGGFDLTRNGLSRIFGGMSGINTETVNVYVGGRKKQTIGKRKTTKGKGKGKEQPTVEESLAGVYSMIKAKLSTAKPKRKVGDADGDGDRDGSFRDKMQKKKLAAKEAWAKAKESARAKADKQRNKALDAIAKHTKSTAKSSKKTAENTDEGLLSKLKDMLLGVLGIGAGGSFLGGLGSIITGALGMGGATDATDLLDVPDGDDKKPKGKKPKGKGSWLRRLASKGKNLAKGAINAARSGAVRAAASAGRQVLMQGARMALTAVVGAVSTPVLIAGAAVAAVGTGAYFAYKYAKRRATPAPLEELRFAQYGINQSQQNELVAIRYLEDKLEDEDIATLDPVDVLADYGSDFGVQDDDAEHGQAFVNWFANRFRPVAAKWQAVANANDSSLTDIHSDIDQSNLIALLDDVRVADTVLAYNVSPFKDGTTVDAGIVKALMNNLRENKVMKAGTDLTKPIPKEQPEGGKTADAVAKTAAGKALDPTVVDGVRYRDKRTADYVRKAKAKAIKSGMSEEKAIAKAQRDGERYADRMAERKSLEAENDDFDTSDFSSDRKYEKTAKSEARRLKRIKDKEDAKKDPYTVDGVTFASKQQASKVRKMNAKRRTLEIARIKNMQGIELNEAEEIALGMRKASNDGNVTELAVSAKKTGNTITKAEQLEMQAKADAKARKLGQTTSNASRVAGVNTVAKAAHAPANDDSVKPSNMTAIMKQQERNAVATMPQKVAQTEFANKQKESMRDDIATHTADNTRRSADALNGIYQLMYEQREEQRAKERDAKRKEIQERMTKKSVTKPTATSQADISAAVRKEMDRVSKESTPKPIQPPRQPAPHRVNLGKKGLQAS